MRKGVRTSLKAAVAALVMVLGLVVPAVSASAAGPTGFDPGNIVSDALFFNPNAYSRAQVTAFIAEKGKDCTPSASGVPCLKDFRVDTAARAGNANCGPIPARTGNTAAGIIHDSATACGINPQMLLVLIQRESNLVTASGPALTTTAYGRATGMACPDYIGCWGNSANFTSQVYWAAAQFRAYRENPGGYNHQVGLNKIAYNEEAVCGRADVRIANRATAGLYNYTPFVPNRASLNAGTGTGDLCSSYGNRNFYLIMKNWFPAAAPSTAPTVYPSPESAVPQYMTDMYARMTTLGLRRVGASTSMITSGDNGTYFKTFAKLSMVWTPTRGATLSHQVPRGTQPPLLPRFPDVTPSTDFADEMEWLRATKVTTGYPDGTYRPVQPVERNAMAAFLYRAAGSPAFTAPSRPSFRDVPVGAPFFKEIEWLKHVGWTTGYNDGTYRPFAHINRDAMAAFLYRAAGSPAYTPPARPTFKDVPVGTQFRKEIEWLASTGITKGWDVTGGKEYRPVTPVNRDAMAAFLYRRAGLS